MSGGTTQAGAALRAQLARRLEAAMWVVRWSEWYDSKLPYFLLCMAYALLATGRHGGSALADLALLLLAVCCYAAFGHVVNDFADREIDIVAGKRRAIAGWSDRSVVATCLVLAAGAIAPTLRFDAPTTILAAAAVLLAGLYSLPPARLKERGVLGWAAAALAQRTLPVAVVFQALQAWDVAAIALAAVGTLIGLRFILVHQMIDRRRDLRAGVRTPATVGDRKRLGRLLRRIVFPAEVATAVVAALAIGVQAPAFAVASALCAAALWFARSRGYPSSIVSYTLLYELYCIVWPIAAALPLALREPLFVPLAALAIALVAGNVVERLRWIGLLRGTRLAVRQSGDHPLPSVPPAPPEAVSAPTAPAGRRTARPAASLPRPSPGDGPAAMLQVSGPDPYPALARMREAGPVHRLRWSWLGPTTVVVRHADTLALLKDPRFIKDPANLEPHEGERSRTPPRRGFRQDLMEVDPPDHTRLRRLVAKAFTTQMVSRLEPSIQELADSLLTHARGFGEIDLVGQYASIIPITVITRLLGVPVPNLANFQRFTYELSFGHPSRRQDAALQARKERFNRHLLNVFEARRREPRDDLVSALVQAEQDGDRLSREELVSLVYLLLLAGYITTVSLIATGVHSLLRHPEQLDLLKRNPALIDGAIDELLRFESPLKVTAISFAREDMEIDGVPITRGTPIRGVLASANRDDGVFRRPEDLDITRDPCPHLAFGQGIHYCIGAPLARMEGRIAILTLLRRLPRARLSDRRPPEWLPHPVLRNLQRLPLLT